MTDSPSLTTSLRTGVKAARANLGFGILLQSIALCLVLAYYFIPSASAILQKLTDFRAQTGLFFGIVSTGLCGGVFPFLLTNQFSPNKDRQSWQMGLFCSLFWAYKGLEIELWYRVLAWLFGAGHEVKTIVLKSVFDQLIYCPIFAVPLTVFAYSWCHHGFNLRKAWADLLTPGWYLRRVLTPLLSNIGVWLPAVAIIYAMPTPLQLPLQNIVLIFFTLMLAHITRKEQAQGKTQH